MVHPIIIQIIAAAAVLGIAIFVHETGHFILAKRKGVRVEKFSLGFGPKLFGFRRGDTEYSLRVIPFGGYLKMAGEDTAERGGAPDEFFSKTPVDRIKIVIAGPFMNLLLAYVVTVVVLIIGVRMPNYSNQIGNISETLKSQGIQAGDFLVGIEGEEISDWRTLVASIEKLEPHTGKCNMTVLREGRKIVVENVKVEELLQLSPLTPPEVGEIFPGTPAYSAGIKAGDRITAIDGEVVTNWDELATIIHRSANKEIELIIEREGETFPIRITPLSQKLGEDNVGIIGIGGQPAPDYYAIRYGWKSIPYALDTVVRQMAMTYKGLWLIITRQVSFLKSVGGPIMIMQMAGEEAKKGLSEFLGFLSVINVVLAAINLIPFPVLDGGHIMFFFVEKLRRKPLSAKTQELTQRVGIALLVTLLFFVSANDILRTVNRVKALHRTETQSP